MSRDYISVQHFERTGRLVAHGHADCYGRPDAIEFVSRSGQRLVDWLGEAEVWIDRWPTREGAAVLLERAADMLWIPCASAIPFDGLYVTQEQQVKVVFSSYVELTPGETYRLQLPNAVITRDTIRIGALQREPSQNADARHAPRLRRRAPNKTAAARRAS